MAEEEVNYASVVFKANKTRTEAKKEEEIVYDEVKGKNETTEQTADTNEFLTEKKADKEADSRLHQCQHLACCLGILCVILLLGIIVLAVYLATLFDESDVSELDQLKRNQTILLADNRNLTNLNNKLSSDYENLKRDHNNLTQACAVLESNVAVLTAENQNLTKKNQELWTQNQELERARKNLTEQIQTMETGGNELNISRAQWSVDAYCPRDSHSRQCRSCQQGWITSQSNCYAVNDAQSANRRTWEEAREDCRGKSSDLVVVTDQAEKKFVSEHSWDSGGTSGYWIGLRVEDGRWKWVDGSDLTDDSWIQQSPTKGHCAISVRDQGWKSMRCGSKNRWSCKKKALSL